jgi:hypothetical protein
MRLSTIFLLVLCATVAFAQYTYPKSDLAKLAVSLPLAVKMLPKTSQVEIEMNKVLREAFDENWDLSQVNFLAPKAFEKLKKSQPADYVFLQQPEILHEDLRMQLEYVDGSLEHRIMATSKSPIELATDEIKSYEITEVPFQYYDFDLKVFDGKKEKLVTTISFINSDLGKHDYVFLVQQLKLMLSASAEGRSANSFQNAEDNLATLSNLKTVFLKDYHEEDVIGKFDKYYEFPYQIVSYHEYVLAILSQDPEVAYLKMIFSRQHNKYMWGMVQASTGRMLSINECGDYKFTGSFEADNIIRPSYLRTATNLNTQLINNYYRTE